jgi:hypothetical protein
MVELQVSSCKVRLVDVLTIHRPWFCDINVHYYKSFLSVLGCIIG